MPGPCTSQRWTRHSHRDGAPRVLHSKGPGCLNRTTVESSTISGLFVRLHTGTTASLKDSCAVSSEQKYNESRTSAKWERETYRDKGKDVSRNRDEHRATRSVRSDGSVGAGRPAGDRHSRVSVLAGAWLSNRITRSGLVPSRTSTEGDLNRSRLMREESRGSCPSSMNPAGASDTTLKRPGSHGPHSVRHFRFCGNGVSNRNLRS